MPVTEEGTPALSATQAVRPAPAARWRGLFKHIYLSTPLPPRLKASVRTAVLYWYRVLVLGSRFHTLSRPAIVICAPSAGHSPESPFRFDHFLAGVAFPVQEDPEVSVIIPVHGQAALTAACLASLARHPGGHRMEVVLVDDCSPDDSGVLFQRVPGVRCVRNDVNLGFLRSCNRGAQAARGRYLVFLNNDTQVLPGWLDELVATLRRSPAAGLVGSRLIYPDGRLQEAGGIIWADGSGWNYGREDDPRRPEYSYLREVDYCSAACILVERETFLTLGGFDEAYAPAYYEDTDLAFRMRARGLRVLYQPLSNVVHFEGGTHGTDLQQGGKRQQVINRETFLQRWRPVLARHGEPGGDVPRARDRYARRRMLVVDQRLPCPDRDSGSLRLVQLLDIFQELGFVITLAADDLRFHERYTVDLQRRGIHCLYWHYTRSLRAHLRREGHCYDLALICRPDAADAHLGEIRRYCSQAAVVYDTVDLHYLREQREAEVTGSTRVAALAARRKRQELAIMRECDSTLVVSTSEQAILRREAPDIRVHVVSNIHEPAGPAPGFGDRSGVLFVGNFLHPPNVDAALFLAREIMPLLRPRLPGVRAYIVGSQPPDVLRAMAAADVAVTGHVDDLDRYLHRARLSVNPLRFGAGVKGKVATAMAAGLPCVVTTVALEGMDLTPDTDCLVAETPAEIADAVVRLYEDQQLWERLAHQGRVAVARKFSREAARSAVVSLLAELDTRTVNLSPA